MLNRIHRWARIRHHTLLAAQARRQLEVATGADFELVRCRLFELTYCPDPMACNCTEAKPLRKLVEG